MRMKADLMRRSDSPASDHSRGAKRFASPPLLGMLCLLATSAAWADESHLAGLAPTDTWTPTVARWIWHAGEPKPHNDYVQFRKTLRLDAPPREAVVRVSADCKYVLWINGQIVGRGPLTTNPKYKQVDTYPVASYLKPGDNVIAALVLQRHRKTSRLWPTRGGVLLELRADKTALGTDTSWKVRHAVEYQSDVPMMAHQYGLQEWFDARKAAVGWRESGFDDSGWATAVEVPDATEYWPAALERRAMPHMLREIMHPVGVVSCFGISPDSPPRTGRLAKSRPTG